MMAAALGTHRHEIQERTGLSADYWSKQALQIVSNFRLVWRRAPHAVSADEGSLLKRLGTSPLTEEEVEEAKLKLHRDATFVQYRDNLRCMAALASDFPKGMMQHLQNKRKKHAQKKGKKGKSLLNVVRAACQQSPHEDFSDPALSFTCPCALNTRIFPSHPLWCLRLRAAGRIRGRTLSLWTATTLCRSDLGAEATLVFP